MTEFEQWRTLSAATGPGNRAMAEAGVRRAYESAGLPGPEPIVDRIRTGIVAWTFGLTAEEYEPVAQT
ncbi:hypothetical protein [Nocardia sp. NPDC051750]|uniref:hypothetical protein n=1 Tax=Nocardia sp. NPDC051750 TaxID=3364325 RepID=UPI0037A68C47